MSNTAKIIIAIIVIILVVWGIGVAVKKDGPVGTSEPVKIGVIAPLTGPLADYGEEVRRGVQAGVGSTTAVSLIFEDDQCDPKVAVTAYQKLAEFDKAKYIIGPACGSPQEAVVPLLKGKEVLSIVPAAASSDLYAASGNNFFNIQYSLQEESKFVAEQMFARGHRKVALVSFKNAFSQTHADSFRKNFKGTIAQDVVLTDETVDLSPEVLKISKAGVDAIYSPDISFFFGSGVPKLRQLKVMVPVYTTYVAELPAVRELVPDVIYSFPGDLEGSEGAVFGLSKQATEVLVQAVTECKGDYSCVKSNLLSGAKFNASGIYTRPIIMKQIKGGQPTILTGN